MRASDPNRKILTSRWLIIVYKNLGKDKKIDITKNARAMRKLKIACEKAKRDLSSTIESTIDIDCLYEGIYFSMKVTRAKFEDLNDGFFYESINADEAVAYGAAVLAANLSDNGTKGVKDMIPLDVTPLSLCIESRGGYMTVIISRNTPIPDVKEQYRVTVSDNQVKLRVSVYQGECGKAKDNIFLDEFTLYGVPPAPTGKEGMNVCFSIDANGILDVSAELSTGNKRSIIIAGSGNVSKDDIDKMLKKVKRVYFLDVIIISSYQLQIL
ncbi:putative Heat shock protein 70 family [Helianthus annuus]|nr:putative Heat shock protein 70 family [Helianthus annuus]